MPDPLTLAALHALVSFSDPRLSPDGTRVAYVRTAHDYAHDRDAKSLVVAAADGTARRVIDPGPFAHAPRWSPDGTRLAYLRHGTGSERDQIVVVRAGGGTPQTVTRAPNGVQHFAWSPDGRRLAYDTPDDEPNAAAAKRHDDLFELGDDGFLTTRPLVPSHLWLVSAAGGRATRLTRGTWSVYEGVAPFAGGPSDPSWSADGRTILIARAPDPHDATTDRSAVAAVDVATGAVRDLGSLRQYVYEPVAGPGGTYAYLRPHGPGPISAMDAVVAPLAGGDGDDRTEALDRDVESLRWAGDTLVATAIDHLQRAIYLIPPQGPPRRVDLGELSVGDADAGPHGELAFVGSGYGRPPEVYVVPAAGSAPRAVSADNDGLRRYAYGRAEVLSWTAPDGQVSEGILVHPLIEQPGVRYPLVVWLHGGPEGLIGLSYAQESLPLGALAAARGWYAFFPNYRGSNDLGSAHEHAIFADPGAGPMSDVMAGLAAAERHAAVDPARECVAGHSYGGFMTSWIVGHDSRWRCAVVADGAIDLVETYNLSGNGNLAFIRDSLGGSPWDGKTAQLYHDGSPISYATRVRTPTLIITGLADQVVPFTESFSFYHALEDNHVPVRLVGIPTAHHSPSDPVRRDAYFTTILDWLGAHLR